MYLKKNNNLGTLALPPIDAPLGTGTGTSTGTPPLPGDYDVDAYYKDCPHCHPELTYPDKQSAIAANNPGVAMNDGQNMVGDPPVLFVDSPSGISEFTNVKYGRIKLYQQRYSRAWWMEWDKGFCYLQYQSPQGTNIPPSFEGNCAAKIPPVEIGTNPLIVNVPFVTPTPGCDCETITEQVQFFIGDEKPQSGDFVEIPYTQTSEECVTDPNAPKGSPNLDCDTIKKIFESKGMPLAGLGNCQNLRGLRGLYSGGDSADVPIPPTPPVPPPDVAETSDNKMYWIAGGSLLGGIILASALAGKFAKH